MAHPAVLPIRGASRALAVMAGLALATAASAASGGPDAFGYTWRDSAEPGVAFAWEEIAATGTVISGAGGDDFNTGFRALSFAFPYYGGRYAQVAACSNGWLSLLDGTSTGFFNAVFPAPGAPQAVIAAFWDDLTVPPGGSITFQDFGDRAVIQWTDVEALAEPGLANTFQVILRRSGVIHVNWLRMDSSRASCSVGIESPDETAGLTAWRDPLPAPPGAAYTVEFLPPPPVPVTIDCATASPLACDDVIAGDLRLGAAQQSRYACTPAALDGREQVYRLDLPAPALMRLTLETVSGNPKLVLLEGCDPNSCMAPPGGVVSMKLGAGTWYAVVDCAAGEEGAYRLRVECLGFTFCGDALLQSTPSANPANPSWWTDDGSWLVHGWLYHPFDADDYALRVDGGTIYDDRGSPGCTQFPSMTHGVSTPSGPAFVSWSAPEATVLMTLSETTSGGCCGLLVTMKVTNTDTVPHSYDMRIFYDTAFGDAATQPPGCSFVDAVDGGPIEVNGTRYLNEVDLLALGADACPGQVQMFTAEDPAWLRSSYEMLPPNTPTGMEFISWGDGDAPAMAWSGLVNGDLIGDCIGDNSLLFIWRHPQGAGVLAPGEASSAAFRIGWGCAFPCDGCESPVLGGAGARVDACRDGIALSWDAAAFPGGGRGTYHVYRSETSFADAIAGAAVASGLSVPAWTDASAVPGILYYYVVQAESLDFPGCGTGPQVAGSTDEIDLGPVRADPDVTPPAANVGSALRATGHGVDTVDFNWLLSPLPAAGEHYVVRRADDRPQGPFAVIATPAGQVWTDPDAPARFVPTHCWFYDVRVADACGNLSAD